MKIRPDSKPFNDLPLWRSVREVELRNLPLPARGIALSRGLDASIARLIALHAGFDPGEPDMNLVGTIDIKGAPPSHA